MIKDVIGFEGLYKISDEGFVLSAKTGKRKATCKGNKGYNHISLVKDGRQHGTTIHRLVLLHFKPNPLGLPQTRHLDGDKDNNHIDNLEWGSQSDNEIDKRQHGTSQEGAGNGGAKLTESQVLEIRSAWAAGGAYQRVIGLRYGISQTTVWSIVRRHTWRHL
jgi:HNH endonuclease